MGITLNMASNDEHVPKIKHYIRTIKEWTCCVHDMLPFCWMPLQMIIKMVHASAFWLNVFPPADGVSDTLSPCSLVVGLTNDYNKHCYLKFGTYTQVHKEHDNTMATCTMGAIASSPTGNDQGGYYFLSLTTGCQLKSQLLTATVRISGRVPHGGWQAEPCTTPWPDRLEMGQCGKR